MIDTSYFAACPTCGADMGVVSPPSVAPSTAVPEDEININQVQLTAFVGDSTCPECETLVYRIDRRPRMVISK